METKCTLCPRKCNVDRTKNCGFCKSTSELKIAKVMLHNWEEPIISGDTNTCKHGSGAIFFSGCTLRCVYCQNYEISQGKIGKIVSVEELSKIFKKLESKGATNINLVTPTQYSDKIIAALDIYHPNIPIVWNTSGFESPEIIKKLKGYVDIFLTDFKYFDNKIAAKYSSAPNYFENCTASLFEMRKIVPTDIVVDGLMQKGIIIRHLVLPYCHDDSIKILDWIKANLGKNTYVSLMSQYTPCGDITSFPELQKSIRPLEYKIVEKHLKELGFENGFVQDPTSASTDFIPEFKKDDDLK